MMIQPVNRLTVNRAAYNWMSAANSLMSFKGNSKASTLQMLTESFRYKAALAMEKTEDNIVKDNIERTFSIFA